MPGFSIFWWLVCDGPEPEGCGDWFILCVIFGDYDIFEYCLFVADDDW